MHNADPPERGGVCAKSIVPVAARWRPPTGTLAALLTAARARAAELRVRRLALEAAVAAAGRPPSFAEALRRSDVAIIAEVKRRSPSKGDINPGLRADDRAAAYAAGGAAAISVLTEPARFGGTADDLRAVAARVAVPVLRKDFIVDPLQLVEARSLGAAAALLIARALEPALLAEMVAAARGLVLEPLVEVRDAGELDRALAAGASVIGVNNRDLETLVIDDAVATRLIPLVPPDVVAIAESGMSIRADVEAAAVAGADAVLVGSALSATGDPTAAVGALAGVPRRRRVDPALR